MIVGRPLTRTRDDIQVDALSESEWRICDRRIAVDNALSVIGFIEKKRNTYEVMEFADGVQHSGFTSMGAAISQFVCNTAPVGGRSWVGPSQTGLSRSFFIP